MFLQARLPCSPLDAFVSALVYYDGPEPAHTLDRFLPDGNTELIVNLSDAPQFIYDNDTLKEIQVCRRAWVSGVRTRPITIPSGKGSKMLIVAFKKGKAHPFYPLPMSKLMDQIMENITINHPAVFVCALTNLVLGALWYSPLLFYKSWQRETGLSEKQLADTNRVQTYGLAFLLALLISYNLAFFLGDGNATPAWGATAGFLAGFGWAAMIFSILALFERRSWRYILIHGGFITVYFTLIGLILGIWQ